VYQCGGLKADPSCVVLMLLSRKVAWFTRCVMLQALRIKNKEKKRKEKRKEKDSQQEERGTVNKEKSVGRRVEARRRGDYW